MIVLGESWQQIMLACSARADVQCHNPDVDPITNITSTETCGTDFAVPYFISFYFLCSFLVITIITGFPV